jgi:AcrR family transcriptional regulator
MPTLWTDTIEAHRREVHDAILDAAAALVDESGLLSVTMSQIAEGAGIGRATLYKYFPDVEAILIAWHDREVSAHLGELAEVRDRSEDALGGLEAVLGALGRIHRGSRGHHDTGLVAFLHRDEQMAHPHQQLSHLVRELVREAIRSGDIRDDMSPDELTTFCLHALAAARNLPSDAAVRRLVTVTMDGMRPAPL